jgi:hypothetical protein
VVRQRFPLDSTLLSHDPLWTSSNDAILLLLYYQQKLSSRIEQMMFTILLHWPTWTLNSNLSSKITLAFLIAA